MPRTHKPLGEVAAGTSTGILDQVAQGFVLLDDAITAFADAHEIAGLAALVGQRIGLPVHAVERAFDAKSPGPATLLCRAAGLGGNGFSAVLRMRRRRLRGEVLNPAHVLADFLQTPMDVAQGAIGMMKPDEP
jgi:hypothetical protein